MPAGILSALIQAAHPAWWLVAIIVTAGVIWRVVRYADRLALAVERLMLACDRRAARKVALTATSPVDRRHMLAVLAELNVRGRRES